MSITLNSITPAAPSGGTNVTWQQDMSGNVSGYIPIAGSAFSVGFFNRGVGANSDVYYYGVPQFACKFLAGAAASRSAAKVAATASTTFTFLKNGTPFATLVFAASGTTGTWTQASDEPFNGTTDILEIDGPATADATLASYGITLVGQRT